ncbi:MAG: hypothetical protein SOZ66_02115, partial [Candidatus Cryptobacteroides sp.]|nr:hypothetical protein [Candidatus Cryptobacteroides sp.]
CCEATFQSRQSYWHFYTNGKDMPIIFTDNREMALAMNIVAQAAFVYDQCTELHVQGSYLRWQ